MVDTYYVQVLAYPSDASTSVVVICLKGYGEEDILAIEPIALESRTNLQAE